VTSTVVRLDPTWRIPSGGMFSAKVEPLYEAPALIATTRPRRGRRTLAHRPRAADRFTLPGRLPHVSYLAWCGTSRQARWSRAVTLGDDVDLCAACEARSAANGVPTVIDQAATDRLGFRPQYEWRRPTVCPGFRSWTWFAGLLCPVCGAEAKPTNSRGYDRGGAVGRHAPGPDLMAPCPVHGWLAWTAPTGQDGTAVGRARCACEWGPGGATP